MNLTQEQRELLKTLVANRRLGQFIFSVGHDGKNLIYGGTPDVEPDLSFVDSSDFRQLADEGFITFDGSRKSGKVTQKGIDAVNIDLSSDYIGRADRAITATEHVLKQFALANQPPALSTPETKRPPELSTPGHKKAVVFIGHGRSAEWYKLALHLERDLKVEHCEFNTEPVAGRSTSSRLEEMLTNVNFAILVATGEVEHADGTKHARENVVHEAGLFQGKLTFAKAIILLEEGCERFSNIDGITYISFRKDNIRDTFYEVDRTLRREHLLPS